jgi:hypothetical protein
MAEQRYTRTDERDFSPGDRIPAGRWGTTVLASGPTHRFFYREELLEAVRQHEYPGRPSRYTCGFAWPGEPRWDALQPGEIEYAVRWEVAGAFVADATLLADIGAVALDEVVRLARLYWQAAEPPVVAEVLVPGDLIVIGRRVLPKPPVSAE